MSLLVPLLSHLPNAPTYQRAQDLPSFCQKILEILVLQPPFEGRGTPYGHKDRVIHLENKIDGEIVQIFTNNAKRHTSYTISTCGTNYRELFLDLGPSLVLFPSDEPYPLDNMKEDYDQVYKQLIEGWDFQEEGDGFLTFSKSKDRTLKEESKLINDLATNFALTDDIQSRHQLFQTFYGYYDERLAIRIRKTALEAVADKFGFKLPKE